MRGEADVKFTSSAHGWIAFSALFTEEVVRLSFSQHVHLVPRWKSVGWRCRNVFTGPLSSVLLIYKCFIARMKLHDVFKLGTMIPIWLFLFRIGLLYLLRIFPFSFFFSTPPLPLFVLSPPPPLPYPLLPSPTLPSLPLLFPPFSYPLLFSKEFRWHSNGHCIVLRSFLNNKGTLTLFFKSMKERPCHVLVYFSVSSLLLNLDCKFFFPHFFLLFTLSLCTLGSVEETVWNIDLLDFFLL